MSSDTDDYWLRARVHRPQMGRFVSRDPIRNQNRYIWPSNSPVTMVDPSGRQGCGSQAGGCQGLPAGGVAGGGMTGGQGMVKPRGTGYSSGWAGPMRPTSVSAAGCKFVADCDNDDWSCNCKKRMPHKKEACYYPGPRMRGCGSIWYAWRGPYGGACDICMPIWWCPGDPKPIPSSVEFCGDNCCRVKFGCRYVYGWLAEGDDDGGGVRDKCGPDVTAVLNLSLVRLETLVNHVLSFWEKASLCMAGWVRWDFVELCQDAVTTDHCPRGRCCDRTVRVGNGCYPDWAVNWSFFGAAAKICGYELDDVQTYLAGTTVAQDAIIAIILKRNEVENPDCYSTWRHIVLKNAWMIAGYNQALTGALIVPPATPRESANCGMCPERWQHTGPFGIQWGFYSE